MPSVKEQGAVYGNLLAYKQYTRPSAQRVFGQYSFRNKKGPKHHENVQRLLEILAINGKLTTWGMAKTHLSDTSNIRSQEKDYRRLLIGRMARGKHTMGLLDIGLVVKDGKNIQKAPADLYRLSLHGILYCLDVINLSEKDLEKMAEKYADVLPQIFGRWKYLKSMIGSDTDRLKTLASGMFMDNIQISNITALPIYELMTYLNVKYQNNFEQINEEDLADQISYWFYTNLLIPSKRSNTNESKQWKKLLDNDLALKKWYYKFVDEAISFYTNRFKQIKNLKS
ncbi:hypothetical protein Nlim_1745 [Candidatus Nitrosarchaeum limnium SFB1]|jgi:hypothetical protein|uniref:Uncharacterized protein n=1 Tax=Candidatus Nitrosarchaeum limnium SFB1 TaxID=886738 RepID=F3KMJ5_9ARCH|nr:hypothetical protein Nlim_1745 [Candidatus Nitrosarchaeum limnium SFB1]